jgi:hypothetical protein
MKKLLIACCCIFTAVTLLCSFSSKEIGSAWHTGYHTYHLEKVQVDSADYIIVTSPKGVAICPASK